MFARSGPGGARRQSEQQRRGPTRDLLHAVSSIRHGAAPGFVRGGRVDGIADASPRRGPTPVATTRFEKRSTKASGGAVPGTPARSLTAASERDAPAVDVADVRRPEVARPQAPSAVQRFPRQID